LGAEAFGAGFAVRVWKAAAGRASAGAVRARVRNVRRSISRLLRNRCRLDPDPARLALGDETQHNGKRMGTNNDVTNCQARDSFRSLSALAMTETELKVIAALAIIGLSSRPNHG
jgi:hypothetical protein